MKVLVTGVKGQLGFDCVRELKERGFNDVVGIDIEDLDLTNESAVKKYIRELKPDVIMHNAAWTAVDKAEECEELCRKINVDAVKFLAESANEVGSKLVYISTDYVFPGCGDSFYEVDDKPNPISKYGKSKLDGEIAAKSCKKSFIVRVSWAFGVNGNNFIKTMLKLAENHKELCIVCDQVGSPTYTYDLSKLLCDMIVTEKYGTYHATNEGVCSWAEFAEEIFKDAALDVKVNHVTTSEYVKNKPNQANRPLNSRLSKKSLDEAGFNRLPSWEDALKRYLKEIKVL